MAYDKVIDSAVLNANLKAVADAIREKGGTSDNLAFPTGFADAISAIEAGGGGLKVEYGTVTIAEDTKSVAIRHNLGVIPKLYMAMNLLSGSTNDVSALRNTLAFYVMSEYFTVDSFRSNKGLIGFADGSAFSVYHNVYGKSYCDNSYATANEAEITIGSVSLNEKFSLRGGSTYFYLIMG